MVTVKRIKTKPPPPPPDKVVIELDLETAGRLHSLLDNGISCSIYDRYFGELGEGLSKAKIPVRRIAFTQNAQLPTGR